MKTVEVLIRTVISAAFLYAVVYMLIYMPEDELTRVIHIIVVAIMWAYGFLTVILRRNDMVEEI